MAGFDGTSLPDDLAGALRERRRGGLVLFSRNLDGGLDQVLALMREAHVAAGGSPLLAVDQEGGRVARLRGPFLAVPSMARVASWNDPTLAERLAHAVGR